MKKILVIALAIVMALGVVALVACEKPQTVTGECSYEAYGNTYGAKVDVTVKGNVITAVRLYTDEETGWHRTTASWKAAEGQLGFAAAEAAYEQWINDVFVGKTVAEVSGMNAHYTAPGKIDMAGLKAESYNLAGATQSSARIIVAVQDALSKLAK